MTNKEFKQTTKGFLNRLKNEEIMYILNNIKRMEERNNETMGFNEGWNSCLDTIIMDFMDEFNYQSNKNYDNKCKNDKEE